MLLLLVDNGSHGQVPRSHCSQKALALRSNFFKNEKRLVTFIWVWHGLSCHYMAEAVEDGGGPSIPYHLSMLKSTP